MNDELLKRLVSLILMIEEASGFVVPSEALSRHYSGETGVA
jgi:hypothetical protein